MKDWLKILISLSVGIILTLIGAYVQLSFNSLYRDIDRHQKCIEELRANKAESVFVEKRFEVLFNKVERIENLNGPR
jgi:low affinity Fe/Cu permease